MRRAARGEDVAIVDSAIGKVRLTGTKDEMPATRTRRRLGHLEGKMEVPKRLMEPMSESELRDWEGDDM